jgi:hypothetical protein
MSQKRNELEVCFHKLDRIFTRDYLNRFKETSEDALDEYQYQIGTMIRLHLLTERSSLHRHFFSLGYETRYEMAMVIIKEYHAWLQDK